MQSSIESPPAARGADRCPYPRPFAPDFSGCPTYQAVTFIPADSMNQRLATILTCRHLTSGNHPEPGRFYPRCMLGTAAERATWLEMVNPERLDRVRVLQEEFDRFSWPHRERLFEAKARTLASTDPEARRDLEQLLTGFLDATDHFLAERNERFREVGLPIGPLMQVIDEWSWAWFHSRELGSSHFSEERLSAFAPESQPFLRPAAWLPWREGGPNGGTAPSRPVNQRLAAIEEMYPRTVADYPVFANNALRISRTLDPPGLRFAGEIDASNVHAVAESLASSGGTGDLRLDMSEVQFCDLGGLRAVVRAARNLGDGRRLVLQGAPGQLQKALQIVGWAELPNLVVAR